MTITRIPGVWMKITHPERIRRGRNRLGYTQTDLANLVRCSQQYISLIENGMDDDCSERVALAICKRLGIELEDAFEERQLNGARSNATSKIGSRSAA